MRFCVSAGAVATKGFRGALKDIAEQDRFDPWVRASESAVVLVDGIDETYLVGARFEDVQRGIAQAIDLRLKSVQLW
jgi:hypothetical protein